MVNKTFSRFLLGALVLAGGRSCTALAQSASTYDPARDYHDGLRYPHLERDPAPPALLDEILTAKQLE